MRDKIVLRKRAVPKVVTLPNGTTFTARHERISRKQLPRNIRVKNVRNIGPRIKNRGILSLDDRQNSENNSKNASKIQQITSSSTKNEK